METRSLVDPELVPFLDRFASPRFTAERLAEIRAQYATAPLATDAAVHRDELRVPGPAGEVRVLAYRPTDATLDERLPAILHIHGGGFVVGTPDSKDPQNRALCAELRCVVVSVDYRLAPETPFPGGLEDCYAALLWLHRQPGVDARRIAVKGESAGGGLAAAIALVARDRGEVDVAFQLLVSPMLDDRTGASKDPHPYAGEFGFTAEDDRFCWRQLVGTEPAVSALAAPARATSLAGVAPAFIQVGALDLFVEEDLEYARRLIRAGVPTELHVYAGAFHGFDKVPTRVGASFTRDAREALRRAFEASPTRDPDQRPR